MVLQVVLLFQLVMALRMHNVHHYLVSLISRNRKNDIFIKFSILLASHLPHVAEYLSISSGAAEDVSDNSKMGEKLDPRWRIATQYTLIEDQCPNHPPSYKQLGTVIL